MPRSLESPEVLDSLKDAASAAAGAGSGRRPHPSPGDWRDQPIYFLMLDRFNHHDGRPPAFGWNVPARGFQGGTFKGVTQQLGYIKRLGCGSIWLSPVQKNLPSEGFNHHGYGIHDYLAIECERPPCSVEI